MLVLFDCTHFLSNRSQQKSLFQQRYACIGLPKRALVHSSKKVPGACVWDVVRFRATSRTGY